MWGARAAFPRRAGRPPPPLPPSEMAPPVMPGLAGAAWVGVVGAACDVGGTGVVSSPCCAGVVACVPLESSAVVPGRALGRVPAAASYMNPPSAASLRILMVLLVGNVGRCSQGTTGNTYTKPRIV